MGDLLDNLGVDYIRASEAAAREERNVTWQETFSRLWDGYTSDKAAKATRDLRYYALREQGLQVTRSVLRNQLKKYDDMGRPNGRTCHVYMLTVSRPRELHDGPAPLREGT